MKLITALLLTLSMGLAYASSEPAKKEEVRKPKSASINCKDTANSEKVECKKTSKEMPKVEKPSTDKK